MILIISLCAEKMSELEFVRPIEQIVGKNYFVKHYKSLTETDLKKADKIILSGTSLKDFEYWNDFEKFLFLKNLKKPVLGICAGMQILVRLFDGELSKIEKIEIGQTQIDFEKNFLGVSGKQKVYFLHKLGVRKIGKNFDVYAKSDKGIAAIKHKSKKIYGVLFHPEVYNREIIENF